MAQRFSPPPPPWLSEGTEHCVTPTGIARRRGEHDGWALDLDSIEALMEFVERYGDVVIERRFKSFPRIEIYDDYRE